MTQPAPLPGIPIYLKTSAAMPRPADPVFYWMTGDGPYLCRNHLFFSSDVPAQRMPAELAWHQATCRVKFPKLGVAALEYVIGFFDEIYTRHGSEAIVLLLWDLRRQRYRLCVPPQKASVWQSPGAAPSAVDVTYDIPTPLPPNHLLVGDIHSHADMSAYSSYTDTHDERFRDGVHVVVGRVDREPPDFHLQMSVDRFRFTLQPKHFFAGYGARRTHIPRSWIQQVKVSVSRPSWTTSYAPPSKTSYGYPSTAKEDLA